MAGNLDEEIGNKETEEPSMFDLTGQFNTDKDLEYKPGLKDLKDMNDEFGGYIDTPISDEEKSGIGNNIRKAKMRSSDDEKELDRIQKSLDAENGKYPGGYKGKKINKIGSSIN